MTVPSDPSHFTTCKRVAKALAQFDMDMVWSPAFLFTWGAGCDTAWANLGPLILIILYIGYRACQLLSSVGCASFASGRYLAWSYQFEKGRCHKCFVIFMFAIVLIVTTGIGSVFAILGRMTVLEMLLHSGVNICVAFYSLRLVGCPREPEFDYDCEEFRSITCVRPWTKVYQSNDAYGIELLRACYDDSHGKTDGLLKLLENKDDATKIRSLGVKEQEMPVSVDSDNGESDSESE